MLDAKSQVAILGTIDPVSQGAGTVNFDVVAAKGYFTLLFIVLTGVLGADATLDFVIKGDTTSGGSFATTVKSATQVVKASGDAKQIMVELNSDEIGMSGFTHFRGQVTVGTAASLISGVVLGLEQRYGNGTGNNIASVVQAL